MKAQSVLVYFRNGLPTDFSILLEGSGPPTQRELSAGTLVTFSEAYKLFASVRKHWREDGTAR